MRDCPSVACAWVGSLGRVGVSTPSSPLLRSPFGWLRSEPGAGEGGRGAAGCEEPPRAAGGSVGPGGARQRAVMSVAARLAAAGTSCIKAGGPGCDSREPGLGSGRQAAAAERRRGCHLREPGSWRFPGLCLPFPRAPGVDICGAESCMCARAGTEEWQCSNSATR